MTTPETIANLEPASPSVQSDNQAAPEETVTKRRRTKVAAAPKTKQAQLVALMLRRQGATIAEMVTATGWQPHSIRGAISGTIKKKLGMAVASETVAGRGRVYRLSTGA
jgi:hypothetical protein